MSPILLCPIQIVSSYSANNLFILFSSIFLFFPSETDQADETVGFCNYWHSSENFEWAKNREQIVFFKSEKARHFLRTKRLSWIFSDNICVTLRMFWDYIYQYIFSYIYFKYENNTNLSLSILKYVWKKLIEAHWKISLTLQYARF